MISSCNQGQIKTMWLSFPFELQLNFQPTVVITTQFWRALTERAVTLLPYIRLCVTTCYLRDGIVLRELQVQKCQQRVCKHTDVVQNGQVGWMVLILLLKMVRSKERSALVIVVQIANTANKLMWKTVDRTLSIILFHHLVIRATVGLTRAKKLKKINWMWSTFKFLCKYICCFIFM